MSCSAKKLFYSGYFAGTIDPVLCCWQDEIHLLGDFLENFLVNGHHCREAAKIFLEFQTIFENLLKFWMFVMKFT